MFWIYNTLSFLVIIWIIRREWLNRKVWSHFLLAACLSAVVTAVATGTILALPFARASEMSVGERLDVGYIVYFVYWVVFWIVLQKLVRVVRLQTRL